MINGNTPAFISLYNHIRQNETTENISIPLFLEGIRNGKWQDFVLPIRTIKDRAQQKIEKEKVPNVTISGFFSKTRKADEITTHSGFIGMDIDNIANEINGYKTLLANDPYVYSCFVSISGTGLCAIFKIDPDRHHDAFDAIGDYLLKKYQIIIDPSGRDVSRPRYVTFDPYIYINENSILFKKYLPKENKRKISSTIFVKTEFDAVVKQMVEQRVSCVEDYRDWLAIGFGLAHEFGKDGRDYFHSLSSCSNKYEHSVCDKQFTYCLKSNRKADKDKITIGTIYWFAKQAGINILSSHTKKIAAATSAGRAAGLSASQIASNLEKFEGIKDAESIIQQAFVAKNSFASKESQTENIIMWLKHFYKLKRNVITKRIEDDGNPLSEIDINSIYLECDKIFEIEKSKFLTILFSRSIKDYNPIKDFIESIEWDGIGRLEFLGRCIHSDTGTQQWRCAMVQKWYLGDRKSVV